MEAAYTPLAGSGSRMAQSAARDDVKGGSLIYATTTLTRTVPTTFDYAYLRVKQGHVSPKYQWNGGTQSDLK
jgi:hypothetical protein